MKHIIILLIIITAFAALDAYFQDFSLNPANLADRESGDLILPAFDGEIGFTNNHLKAGDLEMFEKDHELTSAEKEKLTSSDLNFAGYGSFNLLSFGHRNWEISSRLYGVGYLGNFDREFMELAFEGNESADYELSTSALEDSYFYQFTKTSFEWAYPHGLNFSSLPPVIITSKDSGTFMITVEEVLNYMREMDIYLGARINWYNANGYMEVVESRQQFISCQDSLYASNYSELITTDTEDIDTQGTNSFGFGAGLKIKLPEGWFHLGFDDLGAKLKYGNLVSSTYTNTHLDYLDLLDEDHEAVSQSEETEEVPYEGEREVELGSTMIIGTEYDLGKGFTIMTRYENCLYSFDGFYLGTTYRPVKWLPLKLTYNTGEVDVYNFKFGVDNESFELMLGASCYNGLFNGAKGYGSEFGIKFKF